MKFDLTTFSLSDLRLSLRQQITALAIFAALFATGTVALLVLLNEKSASNAVNNVVNSFTVDRVTRSAQKTYNICSLVQDLIQKSVDTNLNVARATLKEAGGVQPTSKQITWNAINQYTRAATTVTLPAWSVGGQELVDERSFDKHVPVVDTVTAETSDRAQIFQRMSDAGDMLRVATSVPDSDGKRGIGTYIPAINPDGTANAVVRTVLERANLSRPRFCCGRLVHHGLRAHSQCPGQGYRHALRRGQAASRGVSSLRPRPCIQQRRA